MLACDSNGSTYFYIQNIRGDVIMLVNGNGVVQSIRDYDASGQLICKAPRERDPFGFTGGLDAGNGIWKLGARFYDSAKGSFIQQDRYMGDPSDPLSLNRYVYCGLDPVNFVDPTGFMKQDLATLAAKPLVITALKGYLKGYNVTSAQVSRAVDIIFAEATNYEFDMVKSKMSWKKKVALLTKIFERAEAKADDDPNTNISEPQREKGDRGYTPKDGDYDILIAVGDAIQEKMDDEDGNN